MPSDVATDAKPARSTGDDGAFLILGNSAPVVEEVQPLPPTLPVEVVVPLAVAESKAAVPSSPFDILSVSEPAPASAQPATPEPAAAPASSPFFDMLSNSEPATPATPTLTEPAAPTTQDASVSFFDEMSAPESAPEVPVETAEESVPVMFFDEPVEMATDAPVIQEPIAVTQTEEKSNAPSMPDLFTSPVADFAPAPTILEKSLEKKEELRDTAAAKTHSGLPSFFDEPMMDAATPAKTQSVPELCMNVAVNLDGILDHALEECDQLLGAKVQERTEKEELIARLNKEIADLKKRSKNVLDDVKSVDLEITKIKTTRQVFADQKKQAEKTKK